MQFDFNKFVTNPSSELHTITSAKKDDLLEIAKHLGLDVRSSMRKLEIKKAVIEHYMDKGILGSEARQYLSLDTSSLTVDQQLEFERLAVEREKAQLALQTVREREQLAMQAERERFEIVKAEAEVMKAKMKAEAEITKAKMEKEAEIMKAKMEKEAELAIIVEREKAKINIESKETEQEILLNRGPFDLAKNIKLVPAFTEYDPEDYFRLFEETAKHLDWPVEQWVWLIKPKLSGKAAKVIRHLDDINDYDKVKKAILDAFSITEEGYRQKFRNLSKSNPQTFLEFASEKLRAFKRWMKSANVDNFADLVNLIVCEEFKRKLPTNIMLYIEDKQEKDLLKAASMADSYSLIHKNLPGKRAETFVKPVSDKNPEVSDDNVKGSSSTLKCSYCKKEGHTIRNCKDPKCKSSDNFRSKFIPQSTKDQESTKSHDNKNKPVSSVSTVETTTAFKDFIFDGFISLDGDQNKVKVKILRDTGAALSLLQYAAIPNINDKLTGEKVNVRDLTGTSSVPLADIYLDCSIVKGTVKVGVNYKELPVEGIHMLLGNDLAGKLVVPNLIVSKLPPSDSDTSKETSPLNVVTRAQSKKNSDNEPKETEKLLNNVMNRDELIKAQRTDDAQAHLHEQAVDKSEVVKSPCFYYDNGLLMRFYRPAKLSSLDTWGEKRQIVVPTSVRSHILGFAHDGPGGHLGFYKTFYKIYDKFYWPDLRNSVKDYVKTCHVCQVVGKPNQVNPKAPLQPIVVPEEPFEKIVMDCVGPLPKTKGGNQYLLTLMCATTRYPEAIPLRNISAKTIVKQLLKYFTSFGIPKEIQSDRGSNFTSDLFSSVLRELGIKQTLSSAYHPESQGVLERWHQTFKTMLKKFCLESSLDWDEGVNYLVFAIREAPQESLGFSPFEMVYGRQLRGPLALITDEWLKSSGVEQTVTAEKYMEKLNVLSNVREIARENLDKAQLAMKEHFDDMKKVKARKFQIGDLVLAYFPIAGSPLQSKFHGPYKVLRNVNNNTYIIETPDRKKGTQLIHINLLKKYHQRASETGCRDNVNLNVNARVRTDENDEIVNEVVTTGMLGENTQLLRNITCTLGHLSSSQSQELCDLLNLHSNLFSDQPGRCTVLKHDIELEPGTIPIRQHSYRISPAKRNFLREEVTYLLQNGFAHASKSPWASPCLLVPKEGGSYRMCTDYRQVNSKTIKDSYPLPRLDDIIDSVGNAKYVTKLDLLKGYYQVELTEKAKTISAFVTPFGLFQYEVMPFGLSNAPSTFQRLINHIIRGLEGVYAYLDDIVIVGDTWEEHFHRLVLLLEKLTEANLTINLKKSTFGQGTVSYLGHVVGGGNVRPKVANVEAILDYPVPETRKSLRRFLGMVSYYRKFCRNFSSVAAPLYRLTSPKSQYMWDDESQASFEQLKYFLINDPVLKSPDFNKTFSLQVDACDLGAGGVLLQESDGLLHPICYTSSKFNTHQLAYSTIEKELLSLVLAIKKFDCYLHGASQTQVFTDHNPLLFLERSKGHNQRLLRWALFLQNYNLKMNHIKGSQNLMADALSRVHAV